MRTLIIIIALLIAIVIIKRLIINRPRSTTNSAPNGTTSNTTSSTTNDSDLDALDYKNTVQCNHCGTHIPAANAYKSGAYYFCNEAHFKKGKK